ncbi:hypothetical protein ACU6U9_08505 [Pseudomonas sp. HK3]
MKSLNITLLCMMLLIQGISQSYASQMMSASATTPSKMLMDNMPCHDATIDSAMTMSDCCDENCQCHAMASAMFINTLTFAHVSSSSSVHFYKASSFSSFLKSLYRPPIIA